MSFGAVGCVAIAAFFALGTSLEAQQTSMTLTGATISFSAPTATDYATGWINSTTGVTYTIASKGKSVTTRTTTVSILATSASLGSGKVIGDLEWRRSDLATWNPIMLSDTQVEQRVLTVHGTNDPWNNTIFFRMLLAWPTDAPATYSANFQLKLSQTVP